MSKSQLRLRPLLQAPPGVRELNVVLPDDPPLVLLGGPGVPV